MRTRVLAAIVVLASLPIVGAGTSWANESSCANAAAANGYVNANKFLAEVQQDCAVAYGIANTGGGSQAQATAALAAAEQYLRSLGYDADTVAQMDIAGHGV